ncbi:murein hydrolase activator EnvC family protein [Phenylobacterium sp.]|uniref:murein hydrolase activator EnvC family protein n=1 Tax=Phenylobacterium sp. TaxID=1871053 RepID=UPI002F428FF2
MRGRCWLNRSTAPGRSWREDPIIATELALKPPARVLGLAAAVLTLALGAGAVAAVNERARLERLNLEESALSAQQGRNRNQLARLLSVLQRLRRDPPPALLVSPGDARNAVRAAILVKAMTPQLQDRARVFAAEAGEIARQRRLAAVESEALFTAESERADGLRGRVAADASDSLVTAEPDVARLPPSGEGGRVQPQFLLAPSQGRITHAFGSLLTGGGRSNGLSILTARGAAVQSPGDALVQYAGPVKGWGVILILRMAGGYHLVLAGLDRTSVDVGQSVAVGTPVGWMPDERQSASELYFEVREQGVPVNPARWMRTKAG